MVEGLVWTMESWVGTKIIFFSFFFPLFLYWLGLVKKVVARSQMALGSELEKFFSKSFFLGREISFIHFFFRYIVS